MTSVQKQESLTLEWGYILKLSLKLGSERQQKGILLRRIGEGILLKDVMTCELGSQRVLGEKQVFVDDLLRTLRPSCNKSMKLIFVLT